MSSLTASYFWYKFSVAWSLMLMAGLPPPAGIWWWWQIHWSIWTAVNVKLQVKKKETGEEDSICRCFKHQGMWGEMATSSKGYLAPVFVNREGFSVGRCYSVAVPVDSVHQPVVSCGSVWILPWILENAYNNKKVNRSNWEQFSDCF